MAPAIVTIAFRPLLEKICACLGFNKPVYERVDVLRKIGCVVVDTSTPPLAYKFTGDECYQFEDSCEIAARYMCVYLVDRFKILVFDMNLDIRSNCEKCIQLYELNCNVLKRTKENLVPVENYGIDSVGGVDYSIRQVKIEFMDVLRKAIHQLHINVSPVRVLHLDDDLFVAWLTVYAPGRIVSIVLVVSDKCPCVYGAKESMSKKALDVMMKLYNFDIIDVNYYF